MTAASTYWQCPRSPAPGGGSGCTGSSHSWFPAVAAEVNVLVLYYHLGPPVMAKKKKLTCAKGVAARAMLRLPSAPQEMTWRPIDPGEGDGDIPLPDQRAGARVPGHKRRCVTIRGSKEDNKWRRRELTGGGAGGPPVVPEWFVKWEQRADELQCNDVEHHLSELGFHVQQHCCSPAPAPDAAYASAPAPYADDVPAPAPAPAPDDADAPASANVRNPDPVIATSDALDPVTGPPNLGECLLWLNDLALSGAGLKSVEGQNFLLDGVISFLFAQMSSAFAQQDDDIVLVPPGLSFCWGTSRTQTSENFDQVDGRTHWSLLVLHIAADGSSRFVHHDSLGRINLPHAHAPATAPRESVAHGRPHQEPDSNDCGLYVLAVSQDQTGDAPPRSK
ncbi:hypothetical protein BAE44_0005800 [Dichanthelium oligosanthes]|uniref:Ubiquitin-like protease family profile domain-containing protein n=1 Tax=Dichanthelium oligosanthes TaxID=888268 RepID=A0A1E5W718_9POAL|nr:hypothetical protein BAE44_0005800 [Dichanthelium oligosanthes]